MVVVVGSDPARGRVGYTADDAWQIGAHVGDRDSGVVGDDSARGGLGRGGVGADETLPGFGEIRGAAGQVSSFCNVKDGVELTTINRMSEVRAKVAKQLAALKSKKKAVKKQPKRKRADDEEETGGQGSRRKKQAMQEKEKRVTRSEAAKSVERPRPRRLVKNK
jgi:hypothetical protein